MSSDDVASDRVSTEMLEKLIQHADVKDLTQWAESPVDYDVGAATVRDSVFGKLGLPVIWNGEVLIGSQIVDAERIAPKDGGRLLVIDLTPLGWSRNKAVAAAIGEMTAAQSAYVDDQALADIVTKLYQEERALAEASGWGGDEIQLLLDRIEAQENGTFDHLNDSEPLDDSLPPLMAAEPTTKPGDVWLLGRHRLICGDCTNPNTLTALMAGEKAIMVHADPPYGMGKEKDGIANDNLYGPKLDAFQMKWWAACRPHLEDNGSAYIWGNAEDLWRLWWVGGLNASERLSLRSEIVWSKGSAGAGGMSLIGSDGVRQFPPSTERCLFLMSGEQAESTAHNNSDEYWEGWEPVRAHLDGEREKMGWNAEAAKRAAGHSPRSGCHWFTKSQWMMPTQEVYQAWQSAAGGRAFTREWSELHAEWSELHAEWLRTVHEPWLASRAPFDNTHDNMTDVWEFPRVTGDDRYGHATPKPVDLVARAIKSSSRDGEIVLVPFAGTCPEIIAAEQHGRTVRAIELLPAYCDLVARRFQEATNIKPVLEATGEPHDFGAD